MKMGDSIDVINRLQEKLVASGHTLDVSLPQIVVVGCQSAGKSSVLENIVGREFLPRGTDVVTRRPTVVQLEPSEELYATFMHRGNKRFTDFKEVMNEIQNETNRDPGPVGFSSKPILLQIYSPKVLKLTLVDLPGLIKVAVDEQTEDSIREVRNMVLKYIKQPNSIILAVTPANQDIANSDALEIAKTVDPLRVRTIGVLTKLDLMDAGTDARHILDNKKIPLKRGYVAVLNRSQQDIVEGKDIQYSIEKEKNFFETTDCYRDISHKMGTCFLQNMLHEELQKHIKLSLPSVRQELSQKLSSFRKELKELEAMTGCSCGGTGEVRVYMIKLVQKFADQFNREIFGMSTRVKTKELTAGAQMSQKLYTDIQVGLSLPKIPGREEMLITIINVCGLRNCWTMPNLALEAVSSQLLSQYSDILCECVQNIVEILYSSVVEASQTLEHYPNLKSEMLLLIRKAIDDSAFETKEILDKHIKAQMFFVNTFHPDFQFPDVKMDPVQPIKLWSHENPDEDDATSPISFDNETFKDQKAVTGALAKNSFAQKNADLLIEMIKKYLKIQQKQISDTAIKYILLFLVNEVMEYVKNGMVPIILGSTNSNLLLMDCEQDFVRMKEIKSTCDSLEEALNAVQSF